MRSLIAAVVFSGVFASNAHAQHVEWSGSFCITAVTQACTANGWNVGACFSSRYTEPNVGSNGTETRLSLFSRTYAINYDATSSVFGQTFQPATVTRTGYASDQYVSQMRITTERPSPVLSNSQMIRTFGDMTNWDDISGCNISFQAAHTLCPQTYC